MFGYAKYFKGQTDDQGSYCKSMTVYHFPPDFCKKKNEGGGLTFIPNSNSNIISCVQEMVRFSIIYLIKIRRKPTLDIGHELLGNNTNQNYLLMMLNNACNIPLACTL